MAWTTTRSPFGDPCVCPPRYGGGDRAPKCRPAYGSLRVIYAEVESRRGLTTRGVGGVEGWCTDKSIGRDVAGYGRSRIDRGISPSLGQEAGQCPFSGRTFCRVG